MNDDLTPDLEYASAHLDGDLGATERAHGEATSDVAALVQLLAELRTELADVPPPSDERREQALAAALAEFDLLAASPSDEAAPRVAASTATPANGATVLSFFRRKAPVLMGAAAAVVLAGVVGIAALGGRDSNDNDATASRVGSEESTDKEFSVAADGAGGAAPETMAAGGPPSTILGIDGPATAAYVVNTPEELLGIAMLAVSDGVEAPGVPASTTMPDATGGGSGTDAPMAEASNFVCPLTPSQVVVADIIWVGTPAYAVLDTTTGVVSAIDTECTVLVTAAP